MNKLQQTANLAVFVALVFVATIVIRIPIPATSGYFNVGESMIYAAAILYGPMVGGLAGGIGASLADVIGFAIFAPGTFIIKFAEGAIVGFVGYKIRLKIGAVTLWKITSVLFGAILGAATYFIGSNYMGVSGNTFLDQLLWGLVGLFLVTFITVMSLKAATRINWHIIAIVLGGTEMIIGYFLYENLLAILFPGLGIFAISEIPVNIGQMLVGLTIALPTVRAVQRAFPLKSASES